MTIMNPEPGGMFGHLEFEGPFIFIGKMSDGRWVLETPSGDIANVPQDRTNELFPYVEPVLPLERGQMFKRTRHDYTDQVAEVLAVFPGQGSGEVQWVAYHVHYGVHSEPKLKSELAFRRVFGKRVDS